MKPLLQSLLVLTSCTPLLVCAQEADHKTDQTKVLNDVYGGYGAASVYYFKNVGGDTYYQNIGYTYLETDGNTSSAGTFFVGYSRTVTQVIHVGIQFSYQQVKTPVQGSEPVLQGSKYDNIYGMLARVKFSYVNRPVLQLYSGICMGIGIDLYHVDYNGSSYHDRKLLPAGEVVIMGLRAGRKLGGFMEFGFGTLGILNGGISYKFGTE
jgi:hypothetical protein